MHIIGYTVSQRHRNSSISFLYSFKYLEVLIGFVVCILYNMSISEE